VSIKESNENMLFNIICKIARRTVTLINFN